MAQPENPATPSTEPDRWLNRTVVGAGITSALGDFCYETTTVILPGFLAVLGLPAAVLVRRMAVDIFEAIGGAVAGRHQLDHPARRMGGKARRLVEIGPAAEITLDGGGKVVPRGSGELTEIQFTDLITKIAPK